MKFKRDLKSLKNKFPINLSQWKKIVNLQSKQKKKLSEHNLKNNCHNDTFLDFF